MEGTILQPKETCLSRDLHFDHRINNNSSENTTEAHNLIKTMN